MTQILLGFKRTLILLHSASNSKTTHGKKPLSLPSRTRVRVYGRCDARADSADNRHCESHRTHLPEMSNVQYVQVRAVCKEWNKITQ